MVVPYTLHRRGPGGCFDRVEGMSVNFELRAARARVTAPRLGRFHINGEEVLF